MGGPELPVCREPGTKGLLFRRVLCSLQDATLAPSTARTLPMPSSFCYFFPALRPVAMARSAGSGVRKCRRLDSVPLTDVRRGWRPG